MAVLEFPLLTCDLTLTGQLIQLHPLLSGRDNPDLIWARRFQLALPLAIRTRQAKIYSMQSNDRQALARPSPRTAATGHLSLLAKRYDLARQFAPPDLNASAMFQLASVQLERPDHSGRQTEHKNGEAQRASSKSV
jgi:hypothetical protein